MGEQVGFVGLGTMGTPIVARLVKAGHTVHAFDPQATALGRAVDAGAQAAACAGDAAAACGVVFASVTNQEVLGEVLRAPGGILERAAPGTVVVDLGTTSPPRSREYAAAAAGRRIGYLDAPLSGSVPWATEGRLAVMVGGEEATFRRCLPLLQTFGGNIFHLGPVGAGQTAKLCHQLAFMGLLMGLSEALALGERCGLAPARVLEVLNACVAPRHVTEFMAPRLAATGGQTMPGALKLFHKDLQAVQELAREDAGLDLPLGATLLDLFEQAVAAGYTDHDPFRLHELVESGVFHQS
jgi:3-hydroxyisobutyrate dehydrogenase-like beta-hydroxyacid dehydrogenase